MVFLAIPPPPAADVPALSKIQPVSLWTQISDALDCWDFKVALDNGAPGAKKVKVLLTESGWVLGSYSDLCSVATGCAMVDLWSSQLVKAWRARNAQAKKAKQNPRPLCFGRRSGDIIQPDAGDFSGKPDFKSGKLSDREYSISSHSRRLSSDAEKAALHKKGINVVTPRQLEKDKAKASSYSGRTIEAHHVVEDNIFEKLELEKKHPVFSRSGAVTVALNPEFHQRYLSLKKWERESFVKGQSAATVVSALAPICDDLYKDTSLSELLTVSRLIIGAVMGAMG
jgi:hypothetical protein